MVSCRLDWISDLNNPKRLMQHFNSKGRLCHVKTIISLFHTSMAISKGGAHRKLPAARCSLYNDVAFEVAVLNVARFRV